MARGKTPRPIIINLKIFAYTMGRRSTKKFEFAKGIWYFNIKKGYNNNITIKRTELKQALDSYRTYLVTQKGKCEWLGKWDGKKFTNDSYEKLVKEGKAA